MFDLRLRKSVKRIWNLITAFLPVHALFSPVKLTSPYLPRCRERALKGSGQPGPASTLRPSAPVATEPALAKDSPNPMKTKTTAAPPGPNSPSSSPPPFAQIEQATSPPSGVIKPRSENNSHATASNGAVAPSPASLARFSRNSATVVLGAPHGLKGLALVAPYEKKSRQASRSPGTSGGTDLGQE